MQTVLEKIEELLKENNIDYSLSEHEPTITSEDAARIRNVNLSSGAKSMIAKSKDKFFLLVLPGDRKIDWKKAKKILSTKDLSLATESEVEAKTGLVRGSVCPLGNILGLETYFDKSLLENERVNFNAGSIRHSINMKTSNLVKIVNPIIENFTTENDPL